MKNTKLKFAYSMKELMKTHSFDKITVKDIVAGAELTRQTFYRNFEDKFALVNWYFETLVQDSFVELSDKHTLEQMLAQKFEFISGELTFFKVAFKSQSYDSLVEYDYRYILKFYQDIIKKKIGGEIPSDIAFSLELYCKGSIDKTVQWVMDDRRVAPEEIAKLLALALPATLKEWLLDFNG